MIFGLVSHTGIPCRLFAESVSLAEATKEGKEREQASTARQSQREGKREGRKEGANPQTFENGTKRKIGRRWNGREKAAVSGQGGGSKESDQIQ